MGISSAKITIRTMREGMSRSVRSTARPSWLAAWEALNAPRRERISDDRMDHIVFAADNQHRSHRDRAHHVVPQRIGHHPRLRIAHALRKIGVEEHQDRDKDPPGEDASRDVDGRKFRPDDVANADQRGREAGCRPGDAAGVCHGADGLLLIIEMIDDGTGECEESFAEFAKNLQTFIALENLDEPAEAHRAKNIAGRAGIFSLPGLDDLRARDALGPRQIGFHHQRTPQ